jgi:adenine-specific DNA-methyltransferase
VPFEVDITESFGLTWPGKAAARALAVSPPQGTLVPPEGGPGSGNAARHLIVEGDNLPVLKLLAAEWGGRVRAIYIDPPYNTGNDFLYQDDFRERAARRRPPCRPDREPTRSSGSNERRHALWLDMMYPRLWAARCLLREDGLIFVSIDDHEVHHLRVLMDEVFGEAAFVQSLIWQRHGGGSNDARHFATDHEYVLVYARNRDAVGRLRVPISAAARAEFRQRDEYFDERGPFKTKSFRRMRPDDPRPGLQYEIEAPDGTRLFDEWKWEQRRFESGISDGRVLIRLDRNKRWQVEYKLYLNDEGSGERAAVPRSLLLDVERNSRGRGQLRELLGEDHVFNNPKPVGLIRRLLQLVGDPNAVVLDFFAGSGTTGQAVLELNAQDGGARRYILVQRPDPIQHPRFEHIAEITKERMRRAAARLHGSGVGKAELEFRLLEHRNTEG